MIGSMSKPPECNTFSLCYVSWDVRRLKPPEIPAVIEIDGVRLEWASFILFRK